jgi:hypothetical protein
MQVLLRFLNYLNDAKKSSQSIFAVLLGQGSFLGKNDSHES